MTRHAWPNGLRLALAFCIVGGLNCYVEDPPEDVTPIDGKADAWDDANNPARFGANMEYSYQALSGQELATGASKNVPWPDTYWPMMEDGYNMRWNGDAMSPAELYDQAFNGWTPPEGYMDLRPYTMSGVAFDAEYYESMGPATRWAHERGGNYRARAIHNADGTLIESIDADGNGVPDRDLNGDGETDWDDLEGGLEGWFGHCHAWAPAAYSQPEPQHAVTVNDVTFEIADIKAMIEATYEGCGGTLFLGGRCNLREINRDENGRPTDPECRDTNAGSFHVVLLNVMGMLGQSFVTDVTSDYEVWNHPGRSYEIHSQEIIGEAAALHLLQLDTNEYPYNADAEQWVHVDMTYYYVVEGDASASPFIHDIDSYTRERRYEYILELDANGDIIGGEWISDNQPDFMWAPTRNCDARHTGSSSPVVSAANVQTLVDMSTSGGGGGTTGAEHPFNAELASGIAIPDSDEAGISHSITVGESLTIDALRVNVSISHTYVGDLTVSLEHDGVSMDAPLHDRAGGGQDGLTQSFAVSDFNGQDASGTWTLRVIDSAFEDAGTLDDWSVTVITAE